MKGLTRTDRQENERCNGDVLLWSYSNSPNEGVIVVRTKTRYDKGVAILRDAVRNRSTAFSASERLDHSLEGLLPAAHEDIALQIDRIKW